MDKRGIAFETIISMSVILVVFFIIVYFFFLSPSGLNAATKLGEKLGLSSLPSKTEEKLKETEKVPDELRSSFYDLVEAIKKGKNTIKKKCLITYSNFPDSVSDFNINIKESEGTLSISVYDKLGRVDSLEVINGLRPCYYYKFNLDSAVYDDIMITNKNKINNEGYYDVTVLGENYKLLYKDDFDVCFITECDSSCLLTLLLENKIDFCYSSYKEIYTDIFYDDTYYGSLKDWELNIGSKFFGGKAWEYKGNNQNVPNEFKEFGVSEERFRSIFSRAINKEADGVWFNGYYGKIGDWCYKKKKGIVWDSEEWLYNGAENVKERDIDKDKKNRIFGTIEIEDC